MAFPKLDELIQYYATSLPEVYFKIKAALKNEDSTTEEIAKIVSIDPALSARLLKIANSPFFAPSDGIGSIQGALQIVGREQLHLLVLSTVIIDQFNKIPRHIMNLESFWYHSVGCGVLSKEIALRTGKEFPELYFLSGMLHELGTLVLVNKLPDVAETIFSECELSKEPLIKIENEILGYNHCDVAGHLYKAWNLPKPIVEVAFFHHDPHQTEDHSSFVWTINLADLLVDEMQLGSSGEQAPVTIESFNYVEASIEKEDVEELIEDLPDQVEAMVVAFLM